ncbi:hypothetical protein QL285_082820 [Trifolium repens]|nr:hypothetical protein QL285_082820 [Trifolium repens]
MPKGSEEAKYLENYRKSNSYNQGWGGDHNQQQHLPQQSHASALEDTLTQFMKMTQINFETMRINQEATMRITKHGTNWSIIKANGFFI